MTDDLDNCAEYPGRALRISDDDLDLIDSVQEFLQSKSEIKVEPETVVSAAIQLLESKGTWAKAVEEFTALQGGNISAAGRLENIHVSEANMELLERAQKRLWEEHRLIIEKDEILSEALQLIPIGPKLVRAVQGIELNDPEPPLIRSFAGVVGRRETPMEMSSNLFGDKAAILAVETLEDRWRKLIESPPIRKRDIQLFVRNLNAANKLITRDLPVLTTMKPVSPALKQFSDLLDTVFYYRTDDLTASIDHADPNVKSDASLLVTLYPVFTHLEQLDGYRGRLGQDRFQRHESRLIQLVDSIVAGRVQDFIDDLSTSSPSHGPKRRLMQLLRAVKDSRLRLSQDRIVELATQIIDAAIRRWVNQVARSPQEGMPTAERNYAMSQHFIFAVRSMVNVLPQEQVDTYLQKLRRQADLPGANVEPNSLSWVDKPDPAIGESTIPAVQRPEVRWQELLKSPSISTNDMQSFLRSLASAKKLIQGNLSGSTTTMPASPGVGRFSDLLDEVFDYRIDELATSVKDLKLDVKAAVLWNRVLPHLEQLNAYRDLLGEDRFKRHEFRLIQSVDSIMANRVQNLIDNLLTSGPSSDPEPRLVPLIKLLQDSRLRLSQDRIAELAAQIINAAVKRWEIFVAGSPQEKALTATEERSIRVQIIRAVELMANVFPRQLRDAYLKKVGAQPDLPKADSRKTDGNSRSISH